MLFGIGILIYYLKIDCILIFGIYTIAYFPLIAVNFCNGRNNTALAVNAVTVYIIFFTVAVNNVQHNIAPESAIGNISVSAFTNSNAFGCFNNFHWNRIYRLCFITCWCIAPTKVIIAHFGCKCLNEYCLHKTYRQQSRQQNRNKFWMFSHNFLHHFIVLSDMQD